jgi:hypothetical protein
MLSLALVERSSTSGRDLPRNGARFGHFVGLACFTMHLLTDDLVGDLVEVGSQGIGKLSEFWPQRVLKEGARTPNDHALALHPRIAEGLEAVPSTKCSEETPLPLIRDAVPHFNLRLGSSSGVKMMADALRGSTGGLALTERRRCIFLCYKKRPAW